MIEQKTFIVLSHPRSGTTYLNNFILSSNEIVQCYDELFNLNDITKSWLKQMNFKTIRDFPYYFYTKIYNSKYTVSRYVNDFARKSRKITDKEITGFKLFPFQLSSREIEHLIINLQIPVILVRRRNFIQAAISYEIAKATNQWDHRSKANLDNIEIKIENLHRFIRTYYDKLDYYEEVLRINNQKSFKCYYEELFLLDTINAIFDFLGAPKISEIPEWGNKLNTIDRYKKITNLNQIKLNFCNEKYGYLE